MAEKIDDSSRRVHSYLEEVLTHLCEVAVSFSKNEKIEREDGKSWGLLAAFIAQNFNTYIDRQDEASKH